MGENVLSRGEIDKLRGLLIYRGCFRLINHGDNLLFLCNIMHSDTVSDVYAINLWTVTSFVCVLSSWC